jgi:hypothetical protein
MQRFGNITVIFNGDIFKNRPTRASKRSLTTKQAQKRLSWSVAFEQSITLMLLGAASTEVPAQ